MMRRIVFALIALCFATAAVAGTVLQPSIKPAGMPLTYTGNIVTHTAIPNRSVVGPLQYMSRAPVYFRVAVAAAGSIQVVLPNFYDQGNTVEAGAGGGNPTSMTASLEYPSGTCTPFTFSSSATGSAPDNGMLTSDALTVAGGVPINALGWIRIWASNATGLVGTVNNPTDSTNGEALTKGATVADQTVSCGAVTNTTGGNTFRPIAVLASITQVSVCIVGDSRAFGYNDAYTGNAGDLGEIARSIGPTLPYVNMGVGGDSAQAFMSSHANRVQMFNWCSAAIDEYGINDFYLNAETTGQVLTYKNQIQALAPNLKWWYTTVSPQSTSTDSWTTTANQTASANSNPARVPYNDAVRAGTLTNQTGYFDVANASEFGAGSVATQDGGLWCVSGNPGTVAGYCTNDGIHEQPSQYLAILTSGAINPALITR